MHNRKIPKIQMHQIHKDNMYTKREGSSLQYKKYTLMPAHKGVKIKKAAEQNKLAKETLKYCIRNISEEEAYSSCSIILSGYKTPNVPNAVNVQGRNVQI